MKILNYIVLVLLLGIGLQSMAQNSKAYNDGQLSIKLNEEGAKALSQKSITKSKAGIIKTGISSFDKLNEKLEVVQFERMFPYSPQYDARHRKHGLHLWYTVTYKNSEEVETALKMFRALTEVQFVEPVYKTQLIPYQTKPFEESFKKTEQAPFNDPYLPSQWHYNNTEQTGGTAGADINLFKAWQLQTGQSNIIVSIHDEGVDYKHEDLSANMWKNEAELNGLPGVDDDYNGYIDDVYGFNFRTMTGEIKPENHGSHVAGTIAAVNNKGKGVSGVAGGDGTGNGARIMTCQILENANNARSYVYAADNGAVISQNSWGYTSPGMYEQSVLDAIDYFIEEAGNYPGSPMKGGVVIFAAGNSEWDADFYPGYYEKVVAVSATGPTNQIAYYSNYGTWVDISAPGGDFNFGDKNGVLSTVAGNKYQYMQGTSMACPHISGVAALIASEFGGDGFTNDRLLAHLLTSTKDISEQNPNYLGKMGSGLTDAFFTLQPNNGIAPVKINDIQIVGSAQDFITLKWQAPTDQDDANPISYIIYYNTEAITADNLAAAQRITIKSKALAGEWIDAELKDLLPLTTYHIAIKSFDRWGNASELSNSVEASTNAGPMVSLNDAFANIMIDANVSTLASDKFTVFNNGEGILRWKGDVRHASHSFTYGKSVLSKLSSTALSSSFVPKVGKLEAITKIAKTNSKGLVDNAYKEVFYFNIWETRYVIGEEDLSLPNSSATRFEVHDEDGFNLTNVGMLLNYNYSVTQKPVILQVYAGAKVENNNLIFEQELTQNDFYSETSANYMFRLNEQLFFEQGSTFWIVFHVPAGNLYPLGVGRAELPEYEANGLMSNDLGKTWLSMKDALLETGWIWTTSAISQNGPITEYLTINPTEGEMTANKTQEVDLQVDATNLINGTYNASVVLTTNDVENRFVKLPVTITVENQKPVLSTEEIYNLGNVFLGTYKDYEITVKNIGYGNFACDWGQDLMSFNNPDFQVMGYPPTNIAALEEATFKVRYTPSQLGNSNAIVTMQDLRGNEYKFNLFVAAIAPAKIELNPASADFNNVAIGDVLNGSIAISNTGSYPLKYYLPTFADGSNIAQTGDFIHKFGYAKMVENGKIDPNTGDIIPAQNFVWNDISEKGIDVTSFVAKSRAYHQMDLGFEFPYFGDKKAQIYLTAYGILAFNTNSTFNDNPIRFLNQYSPDGMISAWGSAFNVATSGKIYVHRMPGKFIVQYSVFGERYDWMMDQMYNLPVEFQIVLEDNGNITFYYNKANGISDGYQTISIENDTHTDGLLAADYNHFLNPDDPYEYLADGACIKFVNPGLGIVSSVSKPFGTVQVGETVNVGYTIETDNLYEGQFTELLSIVNTDPTANPVYYNINLDITSGGVAQVQVSETELNFGQVFQNASVSKEIIISNTGTKAVTLTSIASDNGYFISNVELPLTLNGGQKVFAKVIPVTNNLVADATDILKITTNEASDNIYSINIIGAVVVAPAIDVQVIVSPTQTLASAEDALSTAQITIENTGVANLEYTIEYSEWLYESQALEGTEIDYTWRINNNTNNAPAYSWIDITETGNVKKGFYGWLGEYFELDLPFTFNYYGVDYNKIKIADNGAATFDLEQEIDPWAPENMNGKKALLAPIWVPGGWGMEYPGDDRPGFYYQELSDMFVMTWYRVGSVISMGSPIEFQVILYKNGNFKFQYKLENDFTSHMGMIGITDPTGENVTEISNRQRIVEDGSAIFFAKKTKQTLAPAEIKTIDMVVDARFMNAGVFNNDLVIENNTPTSSKVIVPATLTVTGAPIAKTIPEIAFGEVMPYDTLNDWGETEPRYYIKMFNVKNEGTDNLTLNSFALENDDFTSCFVETFVSGMWGSYWDNVSNLWEGVLIKPRSSKEFRVRFVPSVSLAGEYANKLTINTSDVNNENLVIDINATIVAPPALVLDADLISVNAPTKAHSETKSFTIDNSMGLSPLKYAMNVFFERVQQGNVRTTTALFGESKNQLEKIDLFASAILSNTKEETYNRVLEYETATSPESSVGFGLTASFTAATRFVAPSTGFNLSHFKTWYRPGNWANSKLDYQIVTGTLANGKVVASGSMQHDVPGGDEVGMYLTFELAEPILLFPNETFYVVVTYPLGADFPQGVAKLDKTLSGTFFYPSEGEWNDLTDISDFKNYAWMIKAMEKEVKTGFWAELDADMQGEIAQGESKTVNVNFNALFAEHGLQTAKIYFNSNDPINRKDSLGLELYLNQAPIFAEYPKNVLVVKENETLTFTFKASDLESDAFDIVLDGTYNGVTLSKGQSIYTVTFTPDYNSARTLTIAFKATDSNGYVNILTVNVSIIDVNRQPIVTQVTDKGYKSGTIFDKIAASSIFSDPDGDKLTYNFTVADLSVVEMGLIGTDFVIMPKGDGSSLITIEATDGVTKSVSTSFKVYVNTTGALAIDEAKELLSFSVFPNPMKTNAEINYSLKENSLVKIEITDIMGKTIEVINNENQSAGNKTITISRNAMASGIYLVKLTVNINLQVLHKLIVE